MNVNLYYYQPLLTADARGRNPDEFRVCAKRFRRTYQQYPPGYPHQLIVTWLRHYGNDDEIDLWQGVPALFQTYLPGVLGQSLLNDAKTSDCDFMVHIISRAYFHRTGWLARLMEAREKHGPGIYGSMVSEFGCPTQTHPYPNPHIRGSLWGADREILAQFPHELKDMQDEYRMECGEWNLARWFENQGAKAMLVRFDGEWERPEWEGRWFLGSDMTPLLNWDRHTDAYGYGRPLEGDKRMDCCTD